MSIGQQIVARANALREANAAQLATRAPTSERIDAPGPVTSEDRLVRAMAERMRDHAASNGSVSEEDLRTFGYSDEAIARFGGKARALANASAVRVS